MCSRPVARDTCDRPRPSGSRIFGPDGNIRIPRNRLDASVGCGPATQHKSVTTASRQNRVACSLLFIRPHPQEPGWVDGHGGQQTVIPATGPRLEVESQDERVGKRYTRRLVAVGACVGRKHVVVRALHIAVREDDTTPNASNACNSILELLLGHGRANGAGEVFDSSARAGRRAPAAISCHMQTRISGNGPWQGALELRLWL